MPHSTRKKKKMTAPNRKRQEIEDADGWTRITSSYDGQTMRKVYITDFHIPQSMKDSIVVKAGEDVQKSLLEEASCFGSYEPMPKDDGATFDTLKVLYERLTKLFEGSELWKALENALEVKILDDKAPIKNCAIVGSGSICGLKDGWIGRHEVAMLQVILLKHTSAVIARKQNTNVSLFAQEPYYNDLDEEFLKSISVQILRNPAAFELPPASTLFYTPNAELGVEVYAVALKPQILITNSKLDFYWRNEQGCAVTDRVSVSQPMYEEAQANPKNFEAQERRPDLWYEKVLVESERNLQAVEAFNSEKQFLSLPEYDAKDLPFHNLHLYFPKDVK